MCLDSVQGAVMKHKGLVRVEDTLFGAGNVPPSEFRTLNDEQMLGVRHWSGLGWNNVRVFLHELLHTVDYLVSPPEPMDPWAPPLLQRTREQPLDGAIRRHNAAIWDAGG